MKPIKILLSLLFIAMFVIVQPSCSAYTKDYYVQDKSVVYQVHHTVSKWSTHDDYRFVRYIAKDGRTQYWLAIEIGDQAKTIFSNTADIVIDSKRFSISKNADDTMKYYLALRRSFSVAFYDIPNEVIEALKASTVSVDVKYLLETRKPIVWSLSQEKLQEFKDVISKTE